ncbi:MAG: ABC transporter permease [Dehalococcoidia bacterium]
MLALTEIRRRKVQFALVTGVVALVAYLTIMVTGLGLGLNERAGTALLGLDGDYLAYADNANLSVIRSRLSTADVEAISSAPGVERASPIGYVASVIEFGEAESDTAAVIGVESGSFAAPQVVDGRPLEAPGEILVDRAWVSVAGTELGDRLPLPIGFETREFTVVGIVNEGFFFFQPATYVTLEDWQDLVYQGSEDQRPAASIVLLDGQNLDGARGDGWEVVTKRAGFENIEGVQAQQSTVDALRYMGLLIGAMVVGVFFYVITLQKVSLLGILKAIGASGPYLAIQGMLQVVVVSVAGAVVAVVLALLTERTLLSSDTVPISFTVGAMVSSSVSVIVAGLIGAALSVRQVASIDPIIAMQQQ